jgi:hypothetical protein
MKKRVQWWDSDRTQVLLGFGSGVLMTALVFTIAHRRPATGVITPDKCNEVSARDPASLQLPPPKFADDLPPVLQSNLEGEVKLRWSPVDGSKRYRAFVLNLKGEKMFTRSTVGMSLYLKEFPVQDPSQPTEFMVAMCSINEKGEEGPQGETRKIIVKPKPGVAAPAVKVIRVED